MSLRLEIEPPSERKIQFTFDGVAVEARAGESIAAALLAAGCRAWRRTALRNEPRGLFCGMGVCFDCLVQVRGQGLLRACQSQVAEGMVVEAPIGAATERIA
jgi:predicted molibdopterin-dependent oxidoreductase YjgC